jgi:hypothetical protein
LIPASISLSPRSLAEHLSATAALLRGFLG